MKVYTSSYWKYDGNQGVQISMTKPSGKFTYRAIPCLMPTWPMLKAWNDVKSLPDDNPKKLAAWDKYTKEYWELLVRIGPENIIAKLSDGDVLLCWCNKRKFCHRTILAEFLRRNGVEVEEYGT